MKPDDTDVHLSHLSNADQQTDNSAASELVSDGHRGFYLHVLKVNVRHFLVRTDLCPEEKQQETVVLLCNSVLAESLPHLFTSSPVVCIIISTHTVSESSSVS